MACWSCSRSQTHTLMTLTDLALWEAEEVTEAPVEDLQDLLLTQTLD